MKTEIETAFNANRHTRRRETGPIVISIGGGALPHPSKKPAPRSSWIARRNSVEFRDSLGNLPLSWRWLITELRPLLRTRRNARLAFGGGSPAELVNICAQRRTVGGGGAIAARVAQSVVGLRA